MPQLNIQVVDFNTGNTPLAFTESLKETGFAALKNHPIDMDLVNDIYTEWDSFFRSDYKHNYLFNKNKQDGYFPFGSEHAKDYIQKDLKEFFQIYNWGIYPSELSNKTYKLFNSLCHISETLLFWVEKNIPNEVSKNLSIPLEQMIKNSPRNMLRIIHYPPIRKTDAPQSVRAAAHEDINLLTLLCSATAPGLQAMDLSGNWHDVPIDPGIIIVNTGDMLQMATNNYFPSTTHRVVNPLNEERQTSRLSMPLFLHPHDYIKLSEYHTAGSYLTQRLEEIGLK